MTDPVDTCCLGEDRRNPDSWDDPTITIAPFSTDELARQPLLGGLLGATLANNLPDVVRGVGLTVRSVESNYTTRNHGALSGIRGLVLHHTGSSSSTAWQVVRDGRSDLAGPLANLVLERDGSVRVISSGVCWHAGTGSWPGIGTNVANAYCLGIEAVYNGSDITAEQRAAYPRLAAALVRAYGFPVSNVIGHREWAPTRKVDPGQIDLPAFRGIVTELLAGGGGGTSDYPTLTEGMVSALIWRLQVWLNRMFSSYSHIDAGPGPTSRYGPQTIGVIKNFQGRVNIPADGVVGPLTWGHLTRFGFR